MARGKNPDGTPKTYQSDARRRPRESVNAPLPRRPAESPNAWHQNPQILSRLEVVEKHRLAGYSALATSRLLGIDYDTVRDDYVRINELWQARAGRNVEALRAEAMRKLDIVIQNGLETLHNDELYTQAVLFNTPVRVRCAGRQEHRTEQLLMADPLGAPGQDTPTTYGEAFSCLVPHEMTRRVYHDEKGAASYRRVAGQVLQAINAAIMNQARLQGLVVEKKALTDSEGHDLPSALRDILLGKPVEIRDDGMPAPARSLDVGLA
jgi:hypothetical protein